MALAAPPPPEMKEAQSAFKTKNYEKVVSLLTPKIDAIPREGFVILGLSYSELKNNSMALKTYSLAQGKFPTDDEIGTLYGMAQISNLKEREAKATLKEVLDRNPKYEPAYLALAKLYEAKKNTYELRLIYVDLVKHIARKPEYLSKLCELYTQEGIYDHAKDNCNSAIAADPREPLNYVHLAMSFNSTGKIAEADGMFKRAADSFSKSESAQFFYGQFLEEQKKFVDAYKYFKRGTDADPKAARSWIGMGFSAIEVQKFDESIKAFEKLCTVDERNAIKHVRRAVSIVNKLEQPDVLRKFQTMIDKCEGSPKNFF